ncbi:MAG: indolepyruvate ferredoxin oxidoreductase family protein [Alphaproteobacteria bacterium]|nr:indolepyruvate ferredoxin oxidoreductase family protein [Alphaproteobacteria bacterium]
MSRRIVTLDDRYAQEDGRVFVSGIQALVRLPLDQRRLDARRGHKTAGFISGYRGSPLGGYDQQLQRAEKFLRAHDIHFWQGLNEDLGATAVWGAQQVGVFPGAQVDGVFGLWYGKAPGVDRTGDVFKHANFAGTSRLGGVLAVAGDDHACKSSTLPSQSEFAFIDAEIPVLNPSSVQEVLDFGLYGWALSRYAGVWTGLIALADTMDSGAVIEVGLDRFAIVEPNDFVLPEAGVSLRGGDAPLDKEIRLRGWKLPAAQAFVRANGLDRVVLDSPRPRFGIVSTGQGVRDVFEALDALGLSNAAAAAAGVAVFKVAMAWPLEPSRISAFAQTCESVLVVEHKRALIEPQLKEALYRAERAPRILGKHDETGAPLLSNVGALSIPEIAKAIYDRLPAEARTEKAKAYFDRVGASLERAQTLQADVHRKPHYCSGCPHNTSTVVPDGSRALAGIGCHYMATFMGRADMTSQMGGEGVAWVGQAPFTAEKHVFVNLGDGTYSHSGSLAIRAAVSAKINITYKILFNGAVAMTGGQDVESGQTVADLVHQLRGEGVAKVVVVAQDPQRHIQRGDLGPLVEIYHRSRLDEVQRRLRDTPGVTVIIYDQVCATEKRRKVKRGLMEASTSRAFINAEVCEGCGDCSRVSNCLSIEPLETELGTKRTINQSTCNQDLSCVNGFCPSFVTVDGAVNAKRLREKKTVDAANLPDPAPIALDRPFNVLFTGVGGTGVTTVSAILGMAAHIDGIAATTLDMAGLAQKGGPVISHLRFAREPEDIRSGRTPTASADALVAGDLIVSASADALALFDKDKTRAAANADLTPTAEFIFDRNTKFESRRLRMRVEKAVAVLDAINAEALAEEYLYDQLYANMILLGFAWAKGLIPVSLGAVRDAITLNGAGVKDNLTAFDIGRVAALAPERLARISPPRVPAAQRSIDDLIAHRATLLATYQNAAYAQRYRDLVEHVRRKESAAGLGDKLTRAAAVSFAKLMAYKDEYEVARLYTNGAWEQALKDTFGGDYKLHFHLAPPLLARRDAQGRLQKMRFGRWMLPAFRVLARLKALRGTAWDVFGKTEERRMERRLRDDYETNVRRLADEISPLTHDIAVRIADIPDQIRGFGHVKEKAVADAAAAERWLWDAYDAARAAPAPAQAAE